MSATETAPESATPVRPDGTAVVVLRWLVNITYLALFAQFALAGFGAFTNLQPNHPHGAYQAHEILGQAIGGLELIVAVVALIARRRTEAIVAGVAFLLVTPGQILLANAGHTTAAIGALHGLVGVIILVLTGWLHSRLARRRGRR